MKLSRILLERFTVYKRRTIVDIPERGLIVVRGNNGSGKSSIPEAVCHALWGKSLRGKTCWLNIKDGSLAGVVLGNGSKVTRKRENNRSHVEIVQPGPGDENDLYDTASKAQAVINQDFGTFEVWRRSCVFSSSDAATFSSATDAERKRLLETILGLSRFDPALEECRGDLRELEKQEAKLRGQVDKIEAAGASASMRVTEVLADLHSLRAPEKPTPWPEPSKKSEDATIVDPFPEDEAAALFEEAEEIDAKLETLGADLERHRAEKEAAASSHGSADARHTVALKAQQRIAKVGAVCTTCEQDVPAEHSARIAEQHSASLATARYDRDAATTALDNARAAIRRVLQEMDTLKQRGDQVDKKIAAARAQNVRHTESLQYAEKAAARDEKRHAEALKHWRSQCAAQEADHAKALARHEAEREKLETRKRAAQESVLDLEDELDAVREEYELAQRDVAEVKACVHALGLKGIRAHVLGQALTGIEAVANYWLGEVVGPDLSLKLKPYSEKKSGGISDSISLTIEGAGAGEYLGASGGERRRFDVAILLALSEVARSSAGEEASTLFFDEVFDALDEDGQESVAEALAQIAEKQAVFVITHSDQLASNLRPDLRLDVDSGVIRVR